MQRYHWLSAILATLLVNLPGPIQASEIQYPDTMKCQQEDDYHGTKVKDPYRWLEDTNSLAARYWIEAQNKLTDSFLSDNELKNNLQNLLGKVSKFEHYEVPFHIGEKICFLKNSGLEEQDILYIKENEEAKPRVLLDPNKLSKDGTTSLSGYSISYDCKYLAYGLSNAGSDWQKWYVRNIKTGIDTEDLLEGVQYSSASWTRDNKGFFYSRYDKSEQSKDTGSKNYFHKIYYHRVGQKQADDVLVIENKEEKEWGFYGQVTPDGNHLIIKVWDGFKPNNRIYLKDLRDQNSKIVKLLDKGDARYDYVASHGSKFWFRTNLEAPNGRLVLVDISKDDPAVEETIPENNSILQSVSIVGGHFFCHYLENAFSKIVEYKTSGKKVGVVKLPGLGTVQGFWGDLHDKTTYYSFTSFNTPATIYAYNIKTRKTKLKFKPKLNFDPDSYKTEQVFVDSKDGTKIPLFITYKKGLKKNGRANTVPTFMYFYGGFNRSVVPVFSSSMIAWMELGGIYAQPCLRGGGEYGEDWHKAGMKKNKHNGFDDIIACSNWLIKRGYTNEKKLCIAGRSNGALMAAVSLLRRPDLFGAVCMNSGVFDMFRFHKFTIGWSWTAEYGSPDNPDDFKYLAGYSPLHNVILGKQYPPSLIITSANDDRVLPFHSYKFAAALQNGQQGENPILIRIETKSGHGHGMSNSQLTNEWVDKLCFLVKTLNLEEQVDSYFKKENRDQDINH